MDILVLKNLSLMTFFISTFVLFYCLYDNKSKYFQSDDRGEEDYYNEANDNIINKFQVAYKLFLPIIKILPLKKYRHSIGKKLITAGIDKGVDSNDFIGFQLFTSIFFGYICFIFFGSVFGILSGIIMGFTYPYLWLFEKKKERHDKILTSMPDIIDMLYLSLEAGMEFVAAVQRVCDIYKEEKNPFAYELYQMYRNLRTGMTKPESYKTMSDRIDLVQVYSLTSLLTQSHEMGSSISECLKTQSTLMHQERFINAEKKGALASQKLFFPLILLIFPIIFIIIFGPYLLKFLYDGSLF